MNLYTFIFLSFISNGFMEVNPDLLYGDLWRLNSQETNETRLVYNRGYSINALEFSEANKLRKMTYWARCGNDSRKTTYAEGTWNLVTSEEGSVMILDFDGEKTEYVVLSLTKEELVLIPKNK